VILPLIVIVLVVVGLGVSGLRRMASTRPKMGADVQQQPPPIERDDVS